MISPFGFATGSHNYPLNILRFQNLIVNSAVATQHSPDTTSSCNCKLSILHFNDLHGYLTSRPGRSGGAGRIATMVRKIAEENKKTNTSTLVLFGGDLISGTPLSEILKGETEFKFLKSLGVTAMVIGNHDFDFGADNLEKLIKGAGFPVLSANIQNETTGTKFATPSVTVSINDQCRIGILGLTTVTTPKTSTDLVAGWKFTDPLEAAKIYLGPLTGQSDIQIALTHLGMKEDLRLAGQFQGLDVVVGGHDHVGDETHCQDVGGRPVCQTPARGKYLGRIDLEVKRGKPKVIKTQLIKVAGDIKPAADIEQLISQASQNLPKLATLIVGTISKTISDTPQGEGAYSTPLGKFTADAMRAVTGADLAFFNSGGGRKALKEGKVSQEDLWTALPFLNYVGTLELKGSEILALIKLSEAKGAENYKPYLNWSGLKYSMIEGKPKATVDGKPLDPDKTYRVATVDFLASGGDGYVVLKPKQFSDTGILIRDAAEKYIKAGQR